MTVLEALAECSQYTQSTFTISNCTLLLTPHSPGVDRPYPAMGGIYREEAIMLLRRFYVQENEKGRVLCSITSHGSCEIDFFPAPEPKPKKDRQLNTTIRPASDDFTHR